MIPNPSLGALQVARQHDGISIRQLREELARLCALAIQQRLHEMRHGLGAERSHGHGEMETVVCHDVCSPCQRIECMTGGVLAVRELW